MHLLALSCTGHYVPLLSLAVAQYSRANADSGFNLQGLAAGDCTFLATLTRKPPLKRIAGLRIASFPSKPSHTKACRSPQDTACVWEPHAQETRRLHRCQSLWLQV